MLDRVNVRYNLMGWCKQKSWARGDLSPGIRVKKKLEKYAETCKGNSIGGGGAATIKRAARWVDRWQQAEHQMQTDQRFASS